MDNDLLIAFTQQIDFFLLGKFQKLVTSFTNVFGVILTAYLLFKLVTSALYGGEIKGFFLIFVWAVFALTFANPAFFFTYLIAPIDGVKTGLIEFFQPQGSNIFEIITTAIAQAQAVMSSGSGLVDKLTIWFYGLILIIPFLYAYMIYCALYLMSYAMFDLTALFGGVILILGAIPVFRGAVKGLFTALIRHAFIMVLLTVVMSMGMSVVVNSLTHFIAIDYPNGEFGIHYWLAVLSPLITVHLMNKVPELASDLIGGSMSDTAGSAGAAITHMKQGGSMLSSAANITSGAGSQTMKGAQMLNDARKRRSISQANDVAGAKK
jgi:hypothetical protein